MFEKLFGGDVASTREKANQAAAAAWLIQERMYRNGEDAEGGVRVNRKNVEEFVEAAKKAQEELTGFLELLKERGSSEEEMEDAQKEIDTLGEQIKVAESDFGKQE